MISSMCGGLSVRRSDADRLSDVAILVLERLWRGITTWRLANAGVTAATREVAVVYAPPVVGERLDATQ